MGQWQWVSESFIVSDWRLVSHLRALQACFYWSNLIFWIVMRCGIVHFIHYQYFKWIRTMYSVTLFQSKIDQVELMSMEGIYLGYKTSAKAVTGICCNSTQKQNPQIWVQSWKSETYCHINCFTRRYFFWWSVSESCDLKWPGVFSGFLCFLPIRWRTDLEI